MRMTNALHALSSPDIQIAGMTSKLSLFHLRTALGARKEMKMKVRTIALASALALSSTLALAQGGSGPDAGVQKNPAPPSTATLQPTEASTMGSPLAAPARRA
jgi:hypothetical protein